jgi:hypothetical protein
MVLTLSLLLFSPRWYTGAKGSSRGSTGINRLLLEPGASRVSGSQVSTTCLPSVPRTYLEFSLIVLDGIGPPSPVELSLRLGLSYPWAALSFCLLRMQKYIIEHMSATRATKPTVRPTAPPVLSPPLPLFRATPVRLCEFGGTVGVTVTVRTCPVTVSSDVTGVGVHVDVADNELSVVLSEVVVAEAGVLEVKSDVDWNYVSIYLWKRHHLASPS